MRIEVNRESLVKLLSASCSVIAKNNTLPVLSSNLFRFNNKRLEIISSNLETTMVVGTNYDLIDGDELDFICDGNAILKTCQLLAIENIYLDVNLDKKGVGNVIFGDPKRKKSYSIPVDFTAESFPKVPSVKSDNEIKIKADLLQKAVNLCLPFCDPNNLVPGFQGLCIRSQDNRFRIASTNGTSISMVESENESLMQETIVSKATCSLFASFDKESTIKISIESETKKLLFTDGSIFLFATLIDGKFPPIDKIYEGVDKESYIVLNRHELNQSIKRLLVIGSRTTHKSSCLDFTKDEPSVSITDIDYSVSGSEDLSISKKTENINYRFGLNGNVLASFVSSFDSEEIVMYTKSNSTPILFTTTDVNVNFDCKLIVAPVLLDNVK
jgi:DNA polymerase III sliding clamp (beta) subunit (PCNA family)